MTEFNKNLANLLNPKSVAIIGASEEEGKIGQVIAKNLTELGYQGKVFFVNPKRETVFGQECYKSVLEIEDNVDLAIIAIPAKLVADLIREASGKVKNFVIISAGFSETADGSDREKELNLLAQKEGLNILGPNCLGFIIPRLKLNASFAGGMPEGGNISFISQSGALIVALMDIAHQEHIKFSNIISIGNKMQIDEAELLDYLSNDENTKVIGMYLEGVKDGKKFIEAAKKAVKLKPVVILKSGKTEKAQKAISSHTGALAGSNDIMDAVFSNAGVLRADNLEEFFNLIKLISEAKVPRNNKAVVITNAGGPGVLTTDAFNGKKIELADLSDSLKNKLKQFLPEESSVENPIDLLGDAMEDRYAKVLDLIGNEDEIGMVISVLTPQDQTPVEKIAEKIIEFKNKTNKLVATIFIGGDRIESAIKKLHQSGIVNFAFPDQAVSALNKYYDWKAFSEKGVKNHQLGLDEKRKSKVAEIIDKARSEGRTALLFSEAKEIMAFYGIETPIVRSINAEEKLMDGIEFPVAIKIDSDKVLHKSDKQGLILGIKNYDELNTAFQRMKENFPGENFIIQPMVSIKNEIIIGIKQDSIFGPVVVYGLGGIYTEIFKMVNFLIPPAEIEDIKRSLAESKINFLFKETRGQKASDIDEMASMLQGIAQLSLEATEIKELDINPLVINEEKRLIAIDVKILI